MIRLATKEDAIVVAQLAAQMWTSHTAEELVAQFRDLLTDKNAAIFLCFDGETAIGFAQCQLRSDYVEGTQTSPVGYLEGIFVSEDHRRHGYAGKLLAACEQWAREQGCREFASDCELDNAQSLAFHIQNGFTEANRIICFTKKIEP